MEAAARLGDGFRLILIGEGPRRTELTRMAEALPPGAVEIREPIPPERAAHLLRASDALLVSLAPGFDGFVPSKLFDFCAMARPVVLASAGEAVKLAEDAQAAVCVPPADPDALAGAVRTLAEDAGSESAWRSEAGSSPTESRDAGVAQLERILAGVVAKAFGTGAALEYHRRDELPGGRRGPMTALVTGAARRLRPGTGLRGDGDGSRHGECAAR